MNPGGPPPGTVRVWVNAGVGSARPGGWDDVAADRAAEWEQMGLVQSLSPAGEPPPPAIRRGCCR